LLRCSEFSAAQSEAGKRGTDSLSPAMPGIFLCGGAIRSYAEYLNATPKKSLPAYRRAIT